VAGGGLELLTTVYSYLLLSLASSRGFRDAGRGRIARIIGGWELHHKYTEHRRDPDLKRKGGTIPPVWVFSADPQKMAKSLFRDKRPMKFLQRVLNLRASVACGGLGASTGCSVRAIADFERGGAAFGHHWRSGREGVLRSAFALYGWFPCSAWWAVG